MSRERTFGPIPAEPGPISEGTLLTVHILAQALPFLNDDLYWEITDLFKEWEEARDKENESREYEIEEELSFILHEDVYDYLNTIAPENHWFGGNEGDPACIGWWSNDPDSESDY